MKKTVRHCIIILLGIINTACSSSNNQEDGPQPTQINTNDSSLVFEIKDSKKQEPRYYSSLFSTITPIILETTDEALLANVTKMEILEDYMIVLDSKVSGIFLFGRDGHFIRKIGRSGQGPGEYIGVNDFTIDTATNTLYVLDRMMQNIISYSFPDGKYINTVRPQTKGVESYYIQYVDGKLYADANSIIETDNEYMLREIDVNTGEQLDCWLNNASYNKGFCSRMAKYFKPETPFHALPYSGVMFMDLFMDTAISINKSRISPFLTVSSNEFVTPQYIQSLKKDNLIDPITIISNINGIYYIRFIFENSQYIYFDYHHPEFSIKTVAYNKVSNQFETGFMLFNDLLYKIDLEKHQGGLGSKIIYADKGGVYTTINDRLLTELHLIIENDQLNLPPTEIEKLKNLDADSNPVLFYYEYKK